MNKTSSLATSMALQTSAEMTGVICVLVTETVEDCNKLINRFPDPQKFIEFEEDVGGLRAFLLAVSEKHVEVLKNARWKGTE